MAFDPLKRAAIVENLVMKGDARQYYRFRWTEFYNGIVTADQLGCNLLCAYCWNYTRNLNFDKMNKYKFLNPSEVVQRIKRISEKDNYRCSGAEPMLGEKSVAHLVDIIHKMNNDNFCVIETNGFMLGYNPDLIKMFKDLRRKIFFRITIKASDPKMFQKVTGAKGDFYKYPIKAIKVLEKVNYGFQVAYNPRFVQPEKLKLSENQDTEIEYMRMYPGIRKNLEERGLN
ncbi:MAG: radical SAM protein [Methanotrichaceae archaeon]|nr:radical SAM protein [Methanotrichaceae archaeon]